MWGKFVSFGRSAIGTFAFGLSAQVKSGCTKLNMEHEQSGGSRELWWNAECTFSIVFVVVCRLRCILGFFMPGLGRSQFMHLYLFVSSTRL